MENWIKILEQKILEKRNIKESEVISTLPFNLLETWDNFMRGKTCPILDDGDHGVYSLDVNQFLNKFQK
jgi:hypothetical protein